MSFHGKQTNAKDEYHSKSEAHPILRRGKQNGNVVQ